MLTELFRPLLRWLFWSPRRLLAAGAGLLLAAAILARLSGCAAVGPPAPPRPAASAPAPGVPFPGASPSPSPPALAALRPGSAAVRPAGG